MFILRIYTKAEKVETNQVLGPIYSIIRKEENPTEFELILTNQFKRLNEDVIYAFVSYDSGREMRPLYKGQSAYIMTESGKTFSNVSDR